ncbi:MAG TPA: hypothetical protein ENK19_01250, partial [Acidobacteria bacterium]|nr:hypothetical protein [Acidobacteriota bacterium]
MVWLGVMAVVCLAGPWPGWNPSPVWGALLLVVVVVLGRPRGAGWAAVAIAALALAFMRPFPGAARLDEGTMTRALETRCRSMLAAARVASEQPKVRQAFAAAGEVLEPSSLFDALKGAVGGMNGRTVYLVDDRGRVVAWAGEQWPVPEGVQLLGERRWRIEWWIRSAALVLREPVMEEGRVLGGILVVDRTPVRGRSIWGMARLGFELRIAAPPRAGWQTLTIPQYPGVSVAVVGDPAGEWVPGPLRYLPWWLLGALALWYGAWGARRRDRRAGMEREAGTVWGVCWPLPVALGVALTGYFSALLTGQKAWIVVPFLL